MLFTSVCVALASQIMQLVYVHETLTAGGGIDSLLLFGRAHKAAVAIGLVVLFGVRGAVLVVFREFIPVGSLVIAFMIIGPALLALACAYLIRLAGRAHVGAPSTALQSKSSADSRCATAWSSAARFRSRSSSPRPKRSSSASL